MQLRPSIICAFGGVALLGACSSIDNAGTAVAYGGNPFAYDSSIKTATTGAMPKTEFGKALKSEYVAYAQREADDWQDFFDADFFAKKAEKVVENEKILPEDPANWRFSAEEIAQKREVRNELISVLDGGARDAMPDTAAIAQARYDCWIEESEEGWQKDLISQCWKEYEAAMEKLKAKPETKPAAQPVAAAPRLFTIFFDFDSSAITPVSKRVLDAAAQQWATSMGDITVVGHTDASGPASYNQKLSQRRADATLQQLEERGVKGDKMESEAVGEGDLLIPTPDGVREPRNRRVTISIE